MLDAIITWAAVAITIIWVLSHFIEPTERIELRKEDEGQQ